MGPGGRYVVERLLGEGASGRVLLCQEAGSGSSVAVKVTKPTRRQWQFGEVEAETLRELERFDAARSRRYCAHLLGTFVYAEESLCLAFEPLAISLRDLVQKAGKPHSLLLSDLRTITEQLLAGLAFMHEVGIAHTDLKCTNVMLRSASAELVRHPRVRGCLAARPGQPCEAVLIDFGNAIRPKDRLTRKGRTGARHVRAPEVVLDVPWDASIDLWSLGTLLSSLYTGRRLFRVHEDVEHLAAMEHICQERIPAALVREVAPRIAARDVAFEARTGRVLWPGRRGDQEAAERVEEMPTLQESVLPQHGRFLELLRGLLKLHPGSRLTAVAALKTAFFSEERVAE